MHFLFNHFVGCVHYNILKCKPDYQDNEHIHNS